ncbi:MAG: BTAD domain-containing putative transcriptional regulator [Chloroflexota bacterium]
MASFEFQLLTTKILPPRSPRFLLRRNRLLNLFEDSAAYPLTILCAGPGYGKSTALSSLVDDGMPTAWLTLEAVDKSAVRFVTYLSYSFSRISESLVQRAYALLEEQPLNDYTTILDGCLNGIADFKAPIRLIIDDVQWLSDRPELLALLDYFIVHSPPNLSIILATRNPIQLTSLINQRLQGNVLEIDQRRLAFTPSEIEQLFLDCYDQPLSPQQAQNLFKRTEGWPIVCSLIYQQLLQGTEINTAISTLSLTESDLVHFLTQQLLDQFPADVRHFLQMTSVLQTLDTAACNAVCDISTSQYILNELKNRSQIVTALDGDRLRYHHLIRDILYHKLTAEDRVLAHQKAGAFAQDQGQIEQAIEHFVAAKAFTKAAPLLEEFGWELIMSGRLSDTAAWIGILPPHELTQRPNLLLQLGDIARLESRYEPALGWYQQAEQIYKIQDNRLGMSKALRGQARIYLDTVRPSHAEEILQKALQLLDGQADRESQARLLDLMAENLLNQGKISEAHSYQQQAQQLRHEGPSSADLPVRLMLRTGRLAEAKIILEQRAKDERTDPVLRPRAHRETLLILSLIHAMLGDHEEAAERAAEGTKRAESLNSPFTLSVGYMRQGAALLLQKDEAGYTAAQAYFDQAITKSQQLNLPRLRVEAMWGMTQIYGFQGNLVAAQSAADQGVAIARSEGDEWIAALIELTLGASYVLAGEFDSAATYLQLAGRHAVECGDYHVVTLARLWQTIMWYKQPDPIRFERDLSELLRLVGEHDYDFLFLNRTLLGPPDPSILIPLLVVARESEIQVDLAQRILYKLNLNGISHHPGYKLRIFTFGGLNIFRGEEEVKWSRQSAKELFQLLITERGRLLHREEIMGLLWGDAAEAEASRHFKTAYSALCRELEPNRRRNSPSAYILRDGSSYGIRQPVDLWLDSQQFDHAVSAGEHATDLADKIKWFKSALALFEGEYLADAPYTEWLMQERWRLHNRYLRAAEQLAGLQQTAADWHGLISTADQMLVVDNCWEPAYRFQMVANARLANLTEVLHIYQRCVSTMQSHLGLNPSEATEILKRQLLTPPTINPNLGQFSAYNNSQS